MKYMSLIQENVKVIGQLNIQLIDLNGHIKQNLLIPNLVVTSGKNFIAARMKTTGIPDQMSHMAIGTSSTAAAVGDTLLGAEIARVALATAGGTVSTNVVTHNATFSPGTGTGAITEAGIFNIVTANTATMLCRTVFAVVNKGADDTMSITWTVTIS
jgi:hypothetical protein